MTFRFRDNKFVPQTCDYRCFIPRSFPISPLPLSRSSGRPEMQQDSLQPAATSNMTPAARSTTAEKAISDQATTPVSPANVGGQAPALMSGEGTASSTAVPGTTPRAEDDGARSMPASSEGGGVGKSNGGGSKRGWSFPVWLAWGKKPADDQPDESNAGSTSTGVRKESPSTLMDGGGTTVSAAGAGTGAGSSGGAVGVGGEEPRAENGAINSEVKDAGAPSTTLLEQTKLADVQPGKTGAGDSSTGVRKEGPPSSASVEKLVAGMDGGGAAVSATGAGTGGGSSGGTVGVGGEAGQGEPRAENGTINSEVKDTGAPSSIILEPTNSATS